MKNHPGLPRVRKPKGKSNVPMVASSADSAPSTRPDDYWTRDNEVNQYYHIESDTGSVYWYEDSEEEEPLKSRSRKRSEVEVPVSRENCS